MAASDVAILGTAGHVDHGKTELVKALTGIDTDRLPEEKQRGMTIDLGFAWLELPGGGMLGIVDVPGHERFVHNMIAGAIGVDMALLVVAADEGPMPQTREHLDVLSILGIRAGVVAVTKADKVEAGRIEQVRDAVRELLAGSGLGQWPIVATSAVTGEGLEELVAELERVARSLPRPDVEAPARLAIDRRFSVAGHGTVVTGSLRRGRLRVGQEVEIMPAGLPARVRHLEIHGREVEEVEAPARVGVNIADVAVEQIQRGDQLVAPGSVPGTDMIDVELWLLGHAEAPIKQRGIVRVHVGSREALGRVVLLDGREELGPCERCVAQIRLDRPVAAVAGDLLVIRSYSPEWTIGGARVLDAAPRRHKVGRAEIVSALERLAAGGPEEALRHALGQAGAGGAEEAELAARTQLFGGRLRDVLDRLAEQGQAVELGGKWFSAQAVERIEGRVLGAVADYHRERPELAGMPLSELQRRTGYGAGLVRAIAERLGRAGKLRRLAGAVALPEHAPKLRPDQQRRVEAAMQAIEAAGFKPPSRAEVLQMIGGADAGQLLEWMRQAGMVVQIGEFVFSKRAVQRAMAVLRQNFRGRQFTASQARQALGTTRKYAIPLLEFLDRIGFTVRRGDFRHVVEQPRGG